MIDKRTYALSTQISKDATNHYCERSEEEIIKENDLTIPKPFQYTCGAS